MNERAVRRMGHLGQQGFVHQPRRREPAPDQPAREPPAAATARRPASRSTTWRVRPRASDTSRSRPAARGAARSTTCAPARESPLAREHSQAAQSSSWASTSVAPSRSATSDSKSGSGPIQSRPTLRAQLGLPGLEQKTHERSRAVAGSRAAPRYATPSAEGKSTASHEIAVAATVRFEPGMPADPRRMAGDIDQSGIALPPSTRLELVHGPRQRKRIRSEDRPAPADVPAPRRRHDTPASGIRAHPRAAAALGVERRFERRMRDRPEQNIRRASPACHWLNVVAGHEHSHSRRSVRGPDRARRRHPLLKLGLEADPLLERPARGDDKPGDAGWSQPVDTAMREQPTSASEPRPTR